MHLLPKSILTAALTLLPAGLPAQTAEPQVNVNLDADGNLILPYYDDFDTDEHLGVLMVVDANSDGYSWYYSDIVYDLRNRCSDEADADDWLLLPPLRMEADKSYRLHFEARAVYPEYLERLEVGLISGAEPEVDNLCKTLMPATDIVERRTHSITVTAPEDGVYRIGFHAVSPAGGFRLAIDNVGIDTPQSALRPGVATSLTATPVANGSLEVNLAFNHPALTVNSRPLADITKTEVLVNGAVVKTLTACTPGAAENLTLTTAQGTNRIEVVSYNAIGRGEVAAVTLYTGDDTPLPPTDVRMEVRDGKAYLTWTPNPVGENGGYIDVSTLRYEIQRRTDFSYVERNYDGTSYVDNLPANTNSRPRQLFYCIRAISAAGKSLDSGDSNRYITGDAMALPFSESFANLNYDDDHYWHSINDGERWNLTNTMTYDNDGGCAKFAPANMGENAIFYTSRLSLQGAQNPLVTFHYWHVKNSDMILEVQVSRENGPFETVRTYDFSQNPEAAGWKKGAVLLDDYTDAEYVLVGWKATAGGIQTITALDAVTIEDVVAADVSVSLAAPAQAAEGQPIMMQATVTNTGAADANGVKVILAHESTGKIAEKTIASIPMGTEAVVEFSTPFHVAPGLKVGAYTATVAWSPDVDYTNDTDRRVVALTAGRLPKPTQLRGEDADGVYTLTWSAPALSGPVTDDFEDYTPFAITDFGQWITIDRDRQLTYQIVEYDEDETGESFDYHPLEYPHAGEAIAFQVFNPTLAECSAPEGLTLSGQQALAAFSAVREHNDDWLISPELSGDAQTVSFHARTGADPMWGYETFEVYTSATLCEPEEMTLLTPQPVVTTTDWQKYSYNLPAGTRHFAIRCTTEQAMLLLIDDIRFTPVDADATLLGYNIYLNGIKANTAPVTTTTYAHPTPEADTEYYVTAQYAEGESPLSNRVSHITSGASVTLPSATEADGVSVRAHDGGVTVSGPGTLDVSVLLPNGQCVATAKATGTLTLPLPAGLYLIRVNRLSHKAVVK